MKTPVVAVGKKGNNKKHKLNEPRGVAFEDESDLIFVCDSYNSCVKVFDLFGEFLYDFGSKQLFRPWGILLHRNYIYVTDIEIDSLFKYQRTNFQFLLSVGKKGDYPGQLAIGHNGCLYVPERGNDRITVLDIELEFKRYLNCEKPVAVKFTDDSMFVLTSTTTQNLNLYNLDGDLIRIFSLIIKGLAYFFTIDCIGNILFSHSTTHSVIVFTIDGDLLSILGKKGDGKGKFRSPYGICTTGDGYLIVASNNKNYGLQIF